ncbi:hypothetical protein VFPPC_17645 [Pochonia chlamydosporia 170]|uniref:Uncharacterized protein n=1 Tax=Pochonia chlamydosporia 170 TaxID=1380566 RepID=A0A219ARF1_METCM|nr:hypothetical protein VFPPC_17645 [Pochonia chlamydosporia 170]OWT43179.1 hypothetical protein VFPPC_17645 [Pochonia chlamydosporia 170]
MASSYLSPSHRSASQGMTTPRCDLVRPDAVQQQHERKKRERGEKKKGLL